MQTSVICNIKLLLSGDVRAECPSRWDYWPRYLGIISGCTEAGAISGQSTANLQGTTMRYSYEFACGLLSPCFEVSNVTEQFLQSKVGGKGYVTN